MNKMSTADSRTKVYQFPYNKTNSDSNPTNLSQPAVDIEEMGKMIERAVSSIMADRALKEMKLNDDPFGSIYFADLEPDKIDSNAYKMLTKFGGKIIDESHSIVFSDDWDD